MKDPHIKIETGTLKHPETTAGRTSASKPRPENQVMNRDISKNIASLSITITAEGALTYRSGSQTAAIKKDFSSHKASFSNTLGKDKSSSKDLVSDSPLGGEFRHDGDGGDGVDL